jgi:hypothetical protein
MCSINLSIFFLLEDDVIKGVVPNKSFTDLLNLYVRD